MITNYWLRCSGKTTSDTADEGPKPLASKRHAAASAPKSLGQSLVGATMAIASMSWDINPTVMAMYHIHTYSPSMMNDRYANPQFVAIIHSYVNPEPNNKKTFSQTRVIKDKVPQLVPRHC